MQDLVPEQHSPSPTPERAVYGFVLYLLATASFSLYLLWLILPEQALDIIGVGSFLPQKYWAVAIPIYLSVAFFLFVFIIYPSLGLIITPSVQDVRNLTDEFSLYDKGCGGRDKIPRVYDIHPCERARRL
jgi:phosphatidylinositol glycan class P protein